jgi:hypothetical protein
VHRFTLLVAACLVPVVPATAAERPLALHPDKQVRFLAPWARSDKPGYPLGGNKFDLSRFDDAYFRRLNAFVGEAGRCGVVVEVNLFCPFYEESQWKLSPFHAANNVNDLGTVARTDVHTLDRHGGLLAVQEALVRKVVAELKDVDNVYYEICNEPYFGGVTMAWQHRIADTIVAAEKDFAAKHGRSVEGQGTPARARQLEGYRRHRRPRTGRPEADG